MNLINFKPMVISNLHKPVLLNEVIDNLHIKPHGIYVDATLGRGGHTQAILSRLNNAGHLYAFDCDADAIAYFEHQMTKLQIKNCTLIQENFASLRYQLHLRDISEVDGIIFDLGVSSPQLDNPHRGFSYNKTAKLDMRMNQSLTKDAFSVVNEATLQELQYILQKFGEMPFAKTIANAIKNRREIKPIVTTTDLSNIVRGCLPSKFLRSFKHPAKQVFQALRIYVNDELDNLQKGLRAATKMLKSGGYLLVISFHSLEDRIVKQYFREISTDPQANMYSRLPYQSGWKPQFELVNHKVIRASEQEQGINRRSQSARLRIIKKV